MQFGLTFVYLIFFFFFLKTTVVEPSLAFLNVRSVAVESFGALSCLSCKFFLVWV